MRHSGCDRQKFPQKNLSNVAHLSDFGKMAAIYRNLPSNRQTFTSKGPRTNIRILRTPLKNYSFARKISPAFLLEIYAGAASAGTGLSTQRQFGNRGQLHEGGPLVDLPDLRVPVQLFDRVILHKT